MRNQLEAGVSLTSCAMEPEPAVILIGAKERINTLERDQPITSMNLQKIPDAIVTGIAMERELAANGTGARERPITRRDPTTNSMRPRRDTNAKIVGNAMPPELAASSDGAKTNFGAQKL